MNLTKWMALVALLGVVITSQAQDYNPYKTIGKNAKVLTLTKGKYVEFFDVSDQQRVGSVIISIKAKKVLKLLNADSLLKKTSDNSASSRWYSVDPLAHTMKNNSYSPYSFVRNNPIVLIDPDGRDWFYYQAQGEKKKTWHFQEGHKATYTNAKGKEVSTSKGFGYLVTYTVTGKNNEGSNVGTITIFNQNKAVLTVPGALTGNDNFKSTEPIPNGNYMMNLSKRDADGPSTLKPDGSNPLPYDGIQKIPDNAQFEWKGNKYPMNPTITDPYGNGRIRLNQTDANLNVVPLDQQEAGYYLHGKNEAHNWTHGCVCDKSEAVFNYFWSGGGKDIRGYVPFVVQ